MSGSSSVAAMKKLFQQLRLEAGLNRVKVSGADGRGGGRGGRRRVGIMRRAGRGARDSAPGEDVPARRPRSRPAFLEK